MKLAVSILLAALLSPVAFADTPRDGELVEVSSELVFIPSGFDDNDEVQVILDGYLPNACYRMTRPEYKLDEDTGVLTVKAMARYFASPCVEALIPFTQVVEVGVLPMGNYKATTNNGDLQKPFHIKEANNAGPDDFLYAPVEGTNVTKSRTGELLATVKGRFTDTCMQWDRSIVGDLVDGAIVIQPLMTHDPGEEFCLPVLVPFEQEITIPNGLEPGRYLLHVRSLNGKAVNRVFTVEDN